MDDGFINRTATLDANGGEGMWNTFSNILKSAFPNLTVKIYHQIAEEDRVTTRKAIIGTHQGILMGINPHHQEKLFDRYFRIQSANRQQISGFGIGLYLSAEIVERHSGKIWVKSELGVGSTFYFSLPID